MLDITKPLRTQSGEPVKIISGEFRVNTLLDEYPLGGYIGNGKQLMFWSKDGKSSIRTELNLEYVPCFLYVNIYMNGNVGTFLDEGMAKDAQTTAHTSIKVAYVPGQKQF